MFIYTTISFWGGIKEWTTSSAFVKRKSQQIKTIPQALEIKANPKSREELNKPPTTFEKLLSWIKKGHLLGVIWFGLSAGSDWLCKKYDLDEKSFLYSIIKTNLPFGTAGGILSLLAATIFDNQTEKLERGKLDLFASRVTVSPDGSTKFSNGSKSEKVIADFNDVILTDYNREILEMGLKRVHDEERGGIFLLRGLSRCGKTMTAETVARKLAKENGKAYFWDITEEGMEKNIADFSKDFGAFFGQESTTARLERILSNAILEDAPVVILLDEAHLMLGATGSKDYNPNDPMQRMNVINQLQKFISSKLKTKDCKNVYMFLTSNSSTNDIATTMAGRMDAVLDYDKPSFQQRKELIKRVIKKQLDEKKDKLGSLKFEDFSDQDNIDLQNITMTELTSLGSKTNYYDYREVKKDVKVDEKNLSIVTTERIELKGNDTLSIEELKPEDVDLLYESGKLSDFTYMASVGTANLLEQYYTGNEERAIEEARYDGFGGKLEILKERPLLQYEIIESLVKNAIIKAADKELDSTKKISKHIKESLQNVVQNILKQRSWWSELTYTFGSREDEFRRIRRQRVA